MAMSDEEKEQRIKELMRVANMSRQQAEFAVAIEAGETTGDIIEIEDGEDNAREK